MRFFRKLTSVGSAVLVLGFMVGTAYADEAPRETFHRSGGVVSMKMLDPETEEDERNIVIDGKAFSVLHDCKGENWKFDADEHTLYLDGYNGLYIDLGQQEDVKVVLTGSNRASSNLNMPALLADGNLTIEGEGELTLDVSACRSAVYARGGNLTIQDTTLTVKGSGDAEDATSLIMADQDVTISHARVKVSDAIGGPGSSIGSLQSDVIITNGADVNVNSTAKALAATAGEITINGAETSVEILAEDSAIYAKKGITLEDGAYLSAKSSKEETTAVYCPEGEIRITASEMVIESPRTAIAGQKIIIGGAYISEPVDSLTQVVSSLVTVVTNGEVVGRVHFLPGTAPTPTPTMTPTPTPSPIPTVVSDSSYADSPRITTRTIIGAGFILTGFVVIIVLLVSRIRRTY